MRRNTPGPWFSWRLARGPSVPLIAIAGILLPVVQTPLDPLRAVDPLAGLRVAHAWAILLSFLGVCATLVSLSRQDWLSARLTEAERSRHAVVPLALGALLPLGTCFVGGLYTCQGGIDMDAYTMEAASWGRTLPGPALLSIAGAMFLLRMPWSPTARLLALATLWLLPPSLGSHAWVVTADTRFASGCELAPVWLAGLGLLSFARMPPREPTP